MAEDEPISYVALTKGTPVLTSSGAELGTVEHVLKDDSLDLFDGLAVKTHDGLRFVTADSVGRITTGSVQTTVADDQVDALPKPDGSPVLTADPEEYDGNALSAWFGRMFLREHWTTKKDDE
ncbi:MAG TPA: hypothetical protein VGM94_02815 [Galbitalea sp.]|jgi:hypothetical protein